MSDVRFDGPVPGEPFAMTGAFDLEADGYHREEWFVSGSARSWTQLGERGSDGRWDAKPDGEADFTTRLVTVRPSEPARFNGTLVVEWMNVSGGVDAAPDWCFVHRHLMRAGAAWIGISVQQAGIDGGGLVPGRPLKQADPERYGGLVHPGDAFAFDIFGRIGSALRTSASGPLADLSPSCLIGIGESQSAGYLVTYANAIDLHAPVYDALLVHGRPAGAAGIDGRFMRPAGDGDVSRIGRQLRRSERIREDVRIPVLNLQSETDLITLGSAASRQPDSEHFRLWEVAGAAHFDTYGLIATHSDDGRRPVRRLARELAQTKLPMGIEAPVPVNWGPQQHYVAQAALAALERWVREGTPPPEAARIETRDGEPAEIATDELGIARGGIRTPWVDAPTAVLSGLGQEGEGFLFLFGTTRPFDEATLARLYPGGADEHRQHFERSLRATLEQGFVLAADADEIRGLADFGLQPSGFALP
jgi:hypothetical protein